MFYFHYVDTKEILIKNKVTAISQNQKAKSLKQFFRGLHKVQNFHSIRYLSACRDHDQPANLPFQFTQNCYSNLFHLCSL